MKIKVFVYPRYVEIESFVNTSPALDRFLKERGVELEKVVWDGRLDSLPTDEKVIVRASSMLQRHNLCWFDHLGSHCLKLGHLCFYDDRWVSMDGLEDARGVECLLEQAAKFLAQQSPARSTATSSLDEGTFTVDGSFRFALQLSDASVGCSGGRCSHCDGPLAFVDEICQGCGMPLSGPGTSIEEWRSFDEAKRQRHAAEVFRQPNHGRLGYANVHSVPLTKTELACIETLAGEDADAFHRVHGLAISKLRSFLSAPVPA